MLVNYYKAYWLGLRADVFPDFKWVDPMAPALNLGSSYKHWGLADEGREPLQGTKPKLCAVANSTLDYEEAWGWAGAACNDEYVFICKASGGLPVPVWQGTGDGLLVLDTGPGLAQPIAHQLASRMHLLLHAGL
jgi:hypothetical protein